MSRNMLGGHTAKQFFEALAGGDGDADRESSLTILRFQGNFAKTEGLTALCGWAETGRCRLTTVDFQVNYVNDGAIERLALSLPAWTIEPFDPPPGGQHIFIPGRRQT